MQDEHPSDAIGRAGALEWLNDRCGTEVSASGIGLTPTLDATGLLRRGEGSETLYHVGDAGVEIGGPDLPVEFLLRQVERDVDCLALKVGDIEIQIRSRKRAPRVWDLNEIGAELRGRQVGGA